MTSTRYATTVSMEDSCIDTSTSGSMAANSALIHAKRTTVSAKTM